MAGGNKGWEWRCLRGWIVLKRAEGREDRWQRSRKCNEEEPKERGERARKEGWTATSGGMKKCIEEGEDFSNLIDLKTHPRHGGTGKGREEGCPRLFYWGWIKKRTGCRLFIFLIKKQVDLKILAPRLCLVNIHIESGL